MNNRVYFDIPKWYQRCAKLAERLRHRCRFFILFINLFYLFILSLDMLVFKFRRFKDYLSGKYDSWTTF